MQRDQSAAPTSQSWRLVTVKYTRQTADRPLGMRGTRAIRPGLLERDDYRSQTTGGTLVPPESDGSVRQKLVDEFLLANFQQRLEPSQYA